MNSVMEDIYGNPSSSYEIGIQAKEIFERARVDIAQAIGCSPGDVIFTSGGSESNNMVLKGLIDFREPKTHHIITAAIEHPAILNPCLYLMELGVEVTILPVDHYGLVDPDDVKKAIRANTTLVSIMLANNETGVIQPIREVGGITKKMGIPFHTDAAQAVGKIRVDVQELGVDFLSLAGHKLYAPKGIGALFVRQGQTLNPLIHGGGQEAGRRSGTENTILGVGLGVACGILEKRLEPDRQRMAELRDRLESLLFDGIEGLVLNGHPKNRLPNTLNVSVPHIEGSKILEGVPALMASTGAACHDQSVKLSHVLAAMAVSPEIGMGALRLTTGRSNDLEQIEAAAEMIIERVRELRQ
jgi:cysteine desulfurase